MYLSRTFLAKLYRIDVHFYLSYLFESSSDFESVVAVKFTQLRTKITEITRLSQFLL